MMFLGYIFGMLKVIFNIFKNELFVYGMFLFRNPKGKSGRNLRSSLSL